MLQGRRYWHVPGVEAKDAADCPTVHRTEPGKYLAQGQQAKAGGTLNLRGHLVINLTHCLLLDFCFHFVVIIDLKLANFP